MVTLSEDGAPQNSADGRDFAESSHRRREIAESFGADAAAYDRGRPRYPEQLVEHVLDTIGREGAGIDILDVGMGTGISALPFRDRGATVLGVEVDERMAALARDRGFTVEIAPFERWDAAGRTFDLVVSGQAWHWIDPAAGAHEAASVLRDGGAIALFWNIMRVPDALREVTHAALAAAIPGLPPAAAAASDDDPFGGQAAKAADGIRASGRFTEPGFWRHDWQRRYTRAEWLDAFPTSGGVNRLPKEQLSPLLARVGAAIDAMGGSFTMGYVTVAVIAKRA